MPMADENVVTTEKSNALSTQQLSQQEVEFQRASTEETTTSELSSAPRLKKRSSETVLPGPGPWRRRLVRHRDKEVSDDKEVIALDDSGDERKSDGDDANGPPTQRFPLPPEDYARYGRQMIVPQVGMDGQLSLKSARVLIVGLGGLGCPAAQYLAGAGVGTLGLMDGDNVEMSNLHRQTLHTPESVGLNKTESAFMSLTRFNDNIVYHVHPQHMTPSIALEIVEGKYDLLLDCTDQPSTHYMLSDIAIIAGIPLISASALKTDGQLLVLNNPPNKPRRTEDEKGFCYRCVFPKPPPASSVQPCSEAGILGPVVGTMGTLMATEAIKLLTKPEPSKLAEEAKRMLIYSAYSDTPFRSIRLKGKRADCPACSWPRKVDRHTLESGSTDYVAFCGSSTQPDRDGCAIDCISPAKLARKFKRKSRPVIIDVRSETEFGIAHLPHAINVPLAAIQRDAKVLDKHVREGGEDGEKKCDMHFICRYGNDSQIATVKAQIHFREREEGSKVRVMDVGGGLKAWKEEVDEGFPEY